MGRIFKTPSDNATEATLRAMHIANTVDTTYERTWGWLKTIVASAITALVVSGFEFHNSEFSLWENSADWAAGKLVDFAKRSLVNEEGQRVFKSFDHYQENEAQPYVVQAARERAQLLYGLDADYEKNLEENKFLQDYEFVDEELRWIDEEGRYVDIDGRLIDENGRFIDTEGNFVDRSGRPLTNEGEYKLDFQPFLDDKGNPIVKEAKEDEEAEEVAEDSSEVTEEEAEEVVSEAKEEKKTTRGRPRKKPATKAKKASVAE